MNINIFNHINSLNSHLACELSKIPEAHPDKEQLQELASLMEVIQKNANILNRKDNTFESMDIFLKFAGKIKKLTKNSGEDGINAKRTELTNLIGQLNLNLSKQIEIRAAKLHEDQKEKEQIYSYFLEKNPEQGDKIRELIDQIYESHHLHELKEGINENKMAIFDSGILKHDPVQQLYIAQKLINIQKFERDKISILYRSLLPIITVPMEAPLKNIYDSLNKHSYFDIIPEAIQATKHLEREIILEYLPYLINLPNDFSALDNKTEILGQIVRNLNNLKKSGLLDQFYHEDLRMSSLILTLENIFTGDPQKDAEIVNFATSALPKILVGDALSKEKVKLFELIIQQPHGKSIILSCPYFFLKNEYTNELTLSTFPAGTQERANLYSSMNVHTTGKGIPIDPYSKELKGISINDFIHILPEDERLEMTSYLTSIEFRWNNSEEFIEKILKNAKNLEHLRIGSENANDNTLALLVHPERLRTLNCNCSSISRGFCPQRIWETQILIFLLTE